MYQQAIGYQVFADIHDRMTVTNRQDDGVLMTTTGTHPELSKMVAVQGVAGLVLLSEIPVDEGMLSASGEATETSKWLKALVGPPPPLRRS